LSITIQDACIINAARAKTSITGRSTAQEVCREVLTLTKLNWNSCAFGSKPVSLAGIFGQDFASVPSKANSGGHRRRNTSFTGEGPTSRNRVREPGTGY
jgi:hypothetical protein